MQSTDFPEHADPAVTVNLQAASCWHATIFTVLLFRYFDGGQML